MTTMNNINNHKKYSLTYFDGAGRAEVIRICLHKAGIDFEDVRIPYAEWKTVYKPQMPLGCVPILNIDGVNHVQSTALARYAGRLAGLYPNGNDQDSLMEALVVDEVMECLNELMAKAPYHSDPQELYKLRTQFAANEMTQYATFLESILLRRRSQQQGDNNNNNDSVIGFTLTPTIADLQLYLTVQNVARGNVNHVEATFFESYPAIMATVHAMQEHPAVVAYYASQTEKKK